MDSNNEANTNCEEVLSELKNEVYQLKDLFYRRLMNDKQKAELIGTVSGLAQFSVLEPFLSDIFLLMDRVEQQDNEFAESVRDELYEILNRRGVERINTEDNFSPEQHRAMRAEESDTSAGSIIGVVRNGYTFNGKVVRPADVVVAKQGNATE